MTNEEQLEFARQMLAEVEDEIEMLEEQRRELKELIADLSAEVIESPYWSEPMANGARMLLAVKDCQQKLLDGNRAEAYYGNTKAVFHHDGFFASLTTDISPDNLRMYTQAQTEHFVRAIIGITFVLARTFTEDDVLIDDYRIPWNGNHGPYKATIKFQEDWNSDSKMTRLRSEAARAMRWTDREYRMAKMRGQEDEWMAEHPHYVPE